MLELCCNVRRELVVDDEAEEAGEFAHGGLAFVGRHHLLEEIEGPAAESACHAVVAAEDVCDDVLHLQLDTFPLCSGREGGRAWYRGWVHELDGVLDPLREWHHARLLDEGVLAPAEAALVEESDDSVHEGLEL